MEYSLNYQLTKDIDFFLIDRDFNLFHFASAGSLLPDNVINNYEENKLVKSSILQMDELFDIEINPELEEFVEFENENMREQYLRDFIYYAKRGFHSYDNTNINNYENQNYHLVAKPVYPKYRIPYILINCFFRKKLFSQSYSNIYNKLKIDATLNKSMINFNNI
ncbi:hypothetical protein CRV03_06910 [Arcobacter sp. F155]|uniref:hypothetical protein n=1 Tax=Arcobacter sp. F155 TaxID=2044512 RepID=UPI00100ADCAB|nr:hypothetical protein [Arcobacter sp. F155]RXJ76987.1 hypothetical protein CRV03_06910 [Arcobacter sp. F155]